MIDLANSEARHLALLHRQMIKLLDQELAPLDLGHGRYLYLFSLHLRGGRTQQELADLVGADKAAAARALARLEAAGYVVRRRDARDGRAVRVDLTPRGRALRPRLEQAAENSISSFTAGLTDPERGELRRLLAKMATPLLTGLDR
jgi:DNA-binding MarR family transcriptional regulator